MRNSLKSLKEASAPASDLNLKVWEPPPVEGVMLSIESMIASLLGGFPP